MKYKLKRNLRAGDLIDVNLGKDVCIEVPEGKKFRAKTGCKYWYVSSLGDVEGNIEQHDKTDDYRYNTGNYFETKEEAEQYKRYLLALQELKDLAEGWEPDWEDEDEHKWCVVCGPKDSIYGCIYNQYIKCQGITYFESEEKAQHAIDVLGKEKLDLIFNYR